jgi:hypothetical protein
MPTFEPIWILYGLLGLGALILVARFGKLLVYGLLVVGVLGAIAFVADALRQQAKATRQTAAAATLATTGQTAGSVGQTVLAVALMLVLIGAAVAIGYLLLRLRRVERRAEGSQIVRHASIGQPTSWASGPNAYWQRTLQPQQPDMQQAVQSLVQLELLRTLRELRSTAQISQSSLPLEEPLEDDDVAWGW